jgi:putative FmdB family regulatory protein
MPSWITQDHRCTACNATSTILHDRAELADPVSCPECGAADTAFRIVTANITQASHVDGSGRFADIKLRRSLEKAKRAAVREGRRDDAVKLQGELITSKGKS